MTIKLRKNERGFMVGEFKDAYDAPCSIQHSSIASYPAIWLGVDDPDLKIMARNAVAIGREDLLDEGPERLNGWVKYPIPDQVLATTRMHLNQAQVAALILLLQYFVEHGELPRGVVEGMR